MTPDDLRQRRKRLGLNQTELAALLGLTQNTISRWEVGSMAIDGPRSLWLDQEMARVEREYKRPRGRPPKKSRRPTPAPVGGDVGLNRLEREGMRRQ